MKKYVTISERFECKCNKKKYKIKITQNYDKRFRRGHYSVVFEDSKGNIVNIITTTCGQPDGKVDQETLNEYIKSFQRDMILTEKLLKDEIALEKGLKNERNINIS